MIEYLVRSTLASGLFIGAFLLLMRRQKSYRLNRFILLASLIFSLFVPLIPALYFQSVELPVNPMTDHFVATPDATFMPTSLTAVPGSRAVEVNRTVNWQRYVLIAYFIIAFLLLVRFFVNIVRLVRTAWRSGANGGANLVLLDAPTAPYSFLRWIFINREDYEHGLPAAVMEHELAHVRQLHSIDVIITEVTQALFWINPFIPLYRRAIRLNHEFLADEAVSSLGTDMHDYGSLLLSTALSSSQNRFASSFNYISIKKRILMLSRKSNPVSAGFRAALLVPVVGCSLLMFGRSVIAQTPTQKHPGSHSVKTASTRDVEWEVKMRRAANLAHPPKEGISQAEFDEYQSAIAASIRKVDTAGSMDNRKGPSAGYLEWKKIHPEKVIYGREVCAAEGVWYVYSFTPAEVKRLDHLFRHMNAKQRDVASFVSFIPLPDPPAKERPSSAQLGKWATSRVYGIWIDGKHVSNDSLASMEPDRFVHYSASGLTPKAQKNDGFAVQIDLFTASGYANTYKARD